MTVVATIEARMTSSRLPGKVLLPALGVPMIHHLVRRLRAVPSIDEIVLATTTNSTDDPLFEYANQERVRIFRGSEQDVLARVIGAASVARADVVVQITGDCPVIDPDLVEQTIRMFFGHDAAYASNSLIRSYPDGMDTQVFRLEDLRRSALMTTDPLDREHVSRHLAKHPDIFPQVHLIAPPSLTWPELGLTLDEEADYRFLKRIIETLGTSNPDFGCGEIVKLLRENPDWVEINRAVVRKGDS